MLKFLQSSMASAHGADRKQAPTQPRKVGPLAPLAADRLAPKVMSSCQFVVIMGQGRSGSTLLLRMLNAVPGVHISGENERAFDHLKAFLHCYETAITRHDTDFYRLAWQLPCPLDMLRAKVASFVTDLYNPGGRHRLIGFKEIRYSLDTYEALAEDIRFLTDLIPGMKIIFNTRIPEDCVKSKWWAVNEKESLKTLRTGRTSFERYHREHPDNTFLAPYEELKRDSKMLPRMFEFLGIEYTDAAKAELDIRLR